MIYYFIGKIQIRNSMKSSNNFSFYLLCLVFASYIIYIRLIMVRLPKELICTQETFSYYLFSFLVLILIIIIKMYLYIFPLSKEVSGNSWVQKIKDKLQLNNLAVYSYKQFKQGQQYLMDHIDYMDNILNFLLKIVLKHYLILRIIYFGLTFGPRYLLAIIFLIESIIFQKLSLFYSCLPILFIPLLGQYILFALKDFVETNLEYLHKSFDVEIFLTHEHYKANAKAYNDYILSLNPGDDYKAFINLKEHIQEYLKEQGRDVYEETKLLVDLFYSLVHYNELSVSLNKLKLKYNIYLQLGSLIIYIISWMYIILFTGEKGYALTEIIKLFNLILILVNKEEPFSGIIIE